MSNYWMEITLFITKFEEQKITDTNDDVGSYSIDIMHYNIWTNGTDPHDNDLFIYLKCL